ncbi:MAG: PilZ domain-containing protein [Myxococcota bacterium]|nr:PilZ domain-containing protein [Myxococcota bacterium]
MLTKQSVATISGHTKVFYHLMEAATAIDFIDILYEGSIVSGNFGFPLMHRKRLPLLNIDAPPPVLGTDIEILYHGMSACWGFRSRIVGYSLDRHWMIALPEKIICNDARRAPRYLLAPQEPWLFYSTQGLGALQLRDLSAFGMSFVYDSSHFTLEHGEVLRGLLNLNAVQLPIVAQVRHTERDLTSAKRSISGCSFDKISDWSRLELQRALQGIPRSIHRRIQ